MTKFIPGFLKASAVQHICLLIQRPILVNWAIFEALFCLLIDPELFPLHFRSAFYMLHMDHVFHIPNFIIKVSFIIYEDNKIIVDKVLILNYLVNMRMEALGEM